MAGMRIALPALLLALAGLGATEPRRLLLETRLEDFGEAAYGRAVETTLAEFEARTGRRLTPGERGRCALKISTAPGQGMSTPRNLIRATADALARRGFGPGSVVVCDGDSRRMRRAGFLPLNPLEPARLGELPVRAWDLECQAWAEDDRYAYENPVPPAPGVDLPGWHSPRRSLLPRPLAEEFDFWVHLPVATDSADLGVHGAVACASLGNATNTARFAGNPRNAAMAAIEMAAWPAIDGRRAITLMSLERYQVRGGPAFDAGWMRSERTLLGSANPLILDQVALLRIRAARGEAPDAGGEPALFQAAAGGGAALGPARPADVTLVRLGAR
jgi:hypothetical protein